ELAIDPLHGCASATLASRSCRLPDLRCRAYGTGLLGSLCGFEGSAGTPRAHIRIGVCNGISAHEPIQTRADAHTPARERLSGRRPADIADSRGSRKGNPPTVSARMR